MNTSLSTVIAKSLPSLSNSALTYNAGKNLYLTTGYTSLAGNTSFRAIRFSNKLAVYYDVCIGYARTFLNGITLYCWDGQNARIIARKLWGGCNNWVDFSEQFAKEQSIIMLKEFLEGQAKMQGYNIPQQQLLENASLIINEVHQKCLA